MQKRCFLFLIFIIFVNAVYANQIENTNPKVEVDYHFAALFAQSSTFREIYKVAPTHQAEISFFLPKNFDLWINFLYLSKNGRSVPLRTKTHIELIPLSLGFKYKVNLKDFNLFAGAGLAYSYLRIKDKSEFVDPIVKKQNVGAFFKSGIKYSYKKLDFLIFVDYLLQHFQFSTSSLAIKRHSTDVGGLLLGLGIGAHF